MTQLRRLLDEQEDMLRGLDAEARRSLAALLADAHGDIEGRIRAAIGRLGPDAYTPRVLGVLKVQVEAGVARLVELLSDDLGQHTARAAKAGIEAILAQVELMEGPIGGALRLDMAGQLLQGRSGLRNRASMERYGEELVATIEQRMAKVLLTHPGRRLAVEQILGALDDSVRARFGRAGLIYRNEMSNAYDDDARRTQERLAKATEGSDDPLLARMDEARDWRSHPFSVVAHGTVAKVGEPWKVPVAQVAAQAGRMKLKASGIVWPVDEAGEFYIGGRYIAHHNDRGRRTCWRRAWGNPQEV